MSRRGGPMTAQVGPAFLAAVQGQLLQNELWDASPATTLGPIKIPASCSGVVLPTVPKATRLP